MTIPPLLFYRNLIFMLIPVNLTVRIVSYSSECVKNSNGLSGRDQYSGRKHHRRAYFLLYPSKPDRLFRSVVGIGNTPIGCESENIRFTILESFQEATCKWQRSETLPSTDNLLAVSANLN